MANVAGLVWHAKTVSPVAGKGMRGSASTAVWFGDPVRLMGEFSCGVIEQGG
jgi:hypothetical protein